MLSLSLLIYDYLYVDDAEEAMDVDGASAVTESASTEAAVEETQDQEEIIHDDGVFTVKIGPSSQAQAG